MNLAKPDELTIDFNAHSVKCRQRKLSETGQFTAEFHYRTIGPVDDIVEDCEEIQAACAAARIGYTSPE